MTWLAPALYLGISWTWCIGMFLPVLLVRDFGFWAWVVFALPNVLGAAAMGFVVRDAQASKNLVEKFRPEMLLFSRWTIAYQAFFSAWMLPQLIGVWTLGLYPLVIGLVILAIRGDRKFTATSALTFLFSVGIGLMLWHGGHLTVPASQGLVGPAFLAPVCLLGFILCPYLDLTFHRGYQQAFEVGGKQAAKLAFAVGFVGVFGPMIVLSLLYSQSIMSPGARVLIGFHMLVQLAVTITMHHVEATRALPRDAKTHPLFRTGTLFVLASAIGLACYFMPDVFGWPAGEYVYRAFLGGYGLLFPVLMLMRVLPDRVAPANRLVTLLVLALPFYAAGFMTLSPQWMIPGTVLVAISPLVARSKNKSL